MNSLARRYLWLFFVYTPTRQFFACPLKKLQPLVQNGPHLPLRSVGTRPEYQWAQHQQYLDLLTANGYMLDTTNAQAVKGRRSQRRGVY